MKSYHGKKHIHIAKLAGGGFADRPASFEQLVQFWSERSVTLAELVLVWRCGLKVSVQFPNWIIWS